MTGPELLRLLGYSSLRTFQWHRQRGMLTAPLYKSLNHGQGVYGLRDEIEAWLQEQVKTDTRRKKTVRRDTMKQQ